jgi:Cu/Ag efflux protein CusF
MRRTVFFVCCGFLLTSHLTLTRARQAPAYESTPVTVTATIEAVDKENRTVTLKGPKRGSVQVKAPEQMEGFNSLRVGDEVTATYFEAIALSVRKPGIPPPAPGPTTSTQRKDRTPGSETRREQTFTVTVEAVDPKAPSITVKGPQGRVVQFMVRDATQLSNIKVGDTVAVTYYESLLIKVSRPSR